MASTTVTIRLLQGDALEVQADVLVLKHAGAFFGVDSAVAALLGLTDGPAEGRGLIRESGDHLGATRVLFLGVVGLWDFRYEQIRAFARDALQMLAGLRVPSRTVAMTFHGAGYGLDEVEAARAQVAGLVEAIRSGEAPADLEEVVIVERAPARLARIVDAVGATVVVADERARRGPARPEPEAQLLEGAGIRSSEKPHVFVAMPFGAETDDVFHYGIQKPVHDSGLLCERIDQETFTGDILTRIKDRIATASLVVAELTGANANVYLEVGYAWGKEVPTVLLARDAGELRFDVRGQRCLIYSRIKDLEELLSQEVRALAAR